MGEDYIPRRLENLEEADYANQRVHFCSAAVVCLFAFEESNTRLEELDLVVGLNGTAIGRADLGVVLVVLAELHNAGVSAVIQSHRPTLLHTSAAPSKAREP